MSIPSGGQMEIPIGATVTIEVPSTSGNHKFDSYDIGGQPVGSNPASFVMNNNISVVANYAIDMATVTFEGSVSGQAAAGRRIVLTVTNPGGETENVETTTLADKTFSATFTDVAGTGYRVIAKALADPVYAEGTSPEVVFDIGLLPTTVTLTVR